MKDGSGKLQFSLVCGVQTNSVQLSDTDNIGKLKLEIYKLYGITPEHQLINGWRNNPVGDDDVLQNCAQVDSDTYLIIKDMGARMTNDKALFNMDDEEIEIQAAISFISKIMNNYDNSTIQFHGCKLQDAISEACMVTLEKRKALCLYLHNEKDKFSNILCENLRKPEVIEILNRNFFFLGYDIEEPIYQSALTKALQRCHDLSTLVPMVESKIAAAVCIVPIQDSVTIFSCIRGKVSNKDFLVALSNTEKFLIAENQQEKNLEELREKTSSENDIGSTNYQKIMADMLGDRDWDRFEQDQHEFLRKKLAFALLGPPQKEEGYEKKDIKKVEALYDSIMKSNIEICKYNGRVEISFMYNCTEPLPSEKMSRAKKYKEYNPNTDVLPLPIFVLRKCHGSANACRIFIDNIGRTYQTWSEYITKNKLHQCEMILPLNGRYEVNETGEVLLERHLSPACGVDSKLLQGADYLSTAGGLISGGIFVAAAIPTIAVAPAALIAGGVIGLGVGIYSMGRSAYTLYDRKKHKETLTFANSEARGAYLSILAGSLGFVGSGATVAVSQLTSVGVNIGQVRKVTDASWESTSRLAGKEKVGNLISYFPTTSKGAGAALKTIGFVNVGASSISMLNSGYDVIDHWVKDNKAASLLTIIQLKSSILFFGNVIHHTNSRDIDEIQAKTMQNYQESLRNNRLRKSFLVLRKEALKKQKGKDKGVKTIIISPIVKIPEKSDVLAVLAIEKDCTEKKGIEFTITDNGVKLNNERIDVSEIININDRDTSVFLSNCFLLSDPGEEDVKFVTEMVLSHLKNVSSSYKDMFVNYVAKLLNCFNKIIKMKIICSFILLLKKMTNSIEQSLDEIFDNQSKYFHLIDFVISFFGKKSEGLNDQWRTWLSTREDKHYLSFFEQIDEEDCVGLQLFERVVDISCQGSYLTEQAERELLIYFYNWLAKQVYDNQEQLEKDWRKKVGSSSSTVEKVPCCICGGYFYKIIKLSTSSSNSTYFSKK